MGCAFFSFATAPAPATGKAREYTQPQIFGLSLYLFIQETSISSCVDEFRDASPVVMAESSHLALKRCVKDGLTGMTYGIINTAQR